MRKELQHPVLGAVESITVGEFIGAAEQGFFHSGHVFEMLCLSSFPHGIALLVLKKEPRFCTDEGRQDKRQRTKRLKNITIETDYSEPNITLAGVSNLKRNGNILTFNYNGEMSRLIKYLHSIDIVNVNIEDASLESMFMYFYSGGEYGDK